MPTLIKTVRLFAGLAAGFILPSKCPLCGRASSSVSGPFCPRCESVFVSADGVLQNAPDRMLYYDASVSLYMYDEGLRKAVSALKSGEYPEVAEYFGRRAADRLREHTRPDIVTFVPVSRKRRRERGYNQAELIARSFGRSLGIQVKGLLAVSGEGNQKRMHYHERFLNMVGRFSGTAGLCSGLSVLLVDDVFTTGATVNECARILKKMGASSVFSLTIARVDDRKAKVAAPFLCGISKKS